ncbi:MAG: hypothetical protein AABY32_06940 [Nanoarchaeota archaeon]
MVKINPTGISRKLKMRKTEKLIKGIFDDSFDITDSLLDIIYVRDKTSQYPLVISLSENVFVLTNRQYFDKTYELAEKYEQLFGTEKTNEKGGEVIIKTNYFSKK